ncbi:MAG: polymerase sigma factor RpoH [Pseudomonadota bacterium]|jgi:RNA polymerase sigma-32 factor
MTTLSLPISSRALSIGTTSLNTLMSGLVSSAHGSIEAYISAVNKTPLLSLEEEQILARRLRDQDDLEAAQRLVISHLRLVVSTARSYLGYGLPHADLIQEGNVGLMKAVRRFDVDRGVRLVSFALHWIRAEIHEYIIKNWRMVKVATTKAQRKLFFNLRSLKAATEANRIGDDQGRIGLFELDVQQIAKSLNVAESDVREMDVRMNGADVLLDPVSEDGETSFAPITWLDDERTEPTQVIARKERENLVTVGVPNALMQLDERSQRIVKSRWLAADGESLTLHDLAAEFNVSAERIRQIEAAALKKMRLLMS